MSEKVKSEVEELERSDPKVAQIQFILGQHYVKPHTTKVACFLLPIWHLAESVSL